MLKNVTKEHEITLRAEFIEECEALITETVFSSRWVLVSGYWELGKLIEEESAGVSITDFTARLAVALNKSQRTLWYCVQLYDKYPNIDELPEGKNISWNKLITKYLPQETEDKPVENFITCPTCAGKGKVKYEIPQN